MRLREVTPAQRRLLDELAGRISNRLETGLEELANGTAPMIGLRLTERGRQVLMEIPDDLLIGAGDDPVLREDLRVRIKSRRDRMLFRPPPGPLPKHVPTAFEPPTGRGGFGRGRR